MCNIIVVAKVPRLAGRGQTLVYISDPFCEA